jgi:hypothetical protein
MSEDVDQVEADQEELKSDSLTTQVADQDSSTHEVSSNEVLSQIALITESISRGDLRNAHRLMAHLTNFVEQDDLKASDRKVIMKLHQQLRADPVELFLPLLFLGVWALIFWLTLH